MPVDPNYKYVEAVHDKTIAKASEGWRYGCHSKNEHPQVEHTLVQDGWHLDGRRRMVAHTPKWKSDPANKACGHLASATDPCCKDCLRRY